MSEDEIITLEAFYDPMLAQIIKGRLEANEIACFIADDIIISVDPINNNAFGGVKLKIFARDLERCKEILAQEPGELGAPDDVSTESGDTCPSCNSTNISFGQATKKRMGWLGLVLSILVFYPVPHPKKIWHCYNCGEEFAEPDLKPELQ